MAGESLHSYYRVIYSIRELEEKREMYLVLYLLVPALLLKSYLFYKRIGRKERNVSCFISDVINTILFVLSGYKLKEGVNVMCLWMSLNID